MHIVRSPKKVARARAQPEQERQLSNLEGLALSADPTEPVSERLRIQLRTMQLVNEMKAREATVTVKEVAS